MLLRHVQLKYIDDGELRVVTCAGAHILDDTIENVATVGVQIEPFGKVVTRGNSKNVVMDVVRPAGWQGWKPGVS